MNCLLRFLRYRKISKPILLFAAKPLSAGIAHFPVFLSKMSKAKPKKLFYSVKLSEKLDKRQIFLYNQIVKFSKAEK